MKRHHYLIAAFASGFTLMLYELCGSRILTPVVGSSSYVWTSIIGVIIAALSLGYVAGGAVADRRARSADISLLFAVAACTMFLTLLGTEAVVSTLARWHLDIRIEAILASLVLFAPTSFALGMVSPYIAKLYITSLTSSGSSVASLSALNSVGGIVGTFLTGFFLFGLIGTRMTIVMGIVLCVAMAIMFARFSLKRTALLGLLMLCSVLAATPTQTFVAAYDTATASYWIYDLPRDDRTLRVLMTGPGGYQSGVYLDNPHKLAFPYTQKTAAIIDELPEPHTILALGGGTFTLPSMLAAQYPEAHIDVVELDPKLASIAREHFSYQDPPNIRIINEDARAFLGNTDTETTYDVIVVDVFSDSFMPFSVTTAEFTELLSKRLSDNGAVITNLIAADSSRCSGLLHGVLASYRDAFAWADVTPVTARPMDTRQNILLVAGHHKPQPDLKSVAFYPLETSHASILTDDFAPVEQLHHRCMQPA